MLANTFFEAAVDQILDVARRFSTALQIAGIPCRIVGGLAVFLHVDDRDPMAARMTRDVDVALDRTLLDHVIAAVTPAGFVYRHAAGVDMFLDTVNLKARKAVHVLFAGERVRADYLEPVPSSPSVTTSHGLQVAPVADLVLMKLTSYRLKDRVHIQDMDSVGLITPEIEAGLSEPLRARLAEVRASE